MSHEYVLPSSLRLELEAQRMYATARTPRLGETAPARVFSCFPVAFDAFTWAGASILVFSSLIPGLDRGVQLLATFALWGLAYAVLPLGRLLFAEARRRHGRGVELTAARFLLGAFTAAVAFLPLASASLSPIVLLAGCRVLQGLAMSGVADPRALGASRSGEQVAGAWAIRLIAAVIGLVAAGALLAVLRGVLRPADFLDWGWRYPFFLAIPINTVALFADLRLLAADDSERPSKSSLARLVTVSGSRVDRDVE